jgi:hypothetical protein
MKILDELERLSLQPKAWAGSPWVQPISAAGSLGKLLQARDALVQKRRELRAPLPPLDSAAVVALWRSCGGRVDGLIGREIRALCRCKETGLLPEVVRTVAAHDSAPRATLWFASLAATYFEQWRGMARADDLEKELRTYAKRYAGRSSTLAKYRDHATTVFSPKAATFLADTAFDEQRRLEHVLAEWGIPVATGLARSAREKLIDRWIERWKSKQSELSDAYALHELSFLTLELLPQVTGEAFYRAVEAIVLAPVATKFEAVGRFVRDYVLVHPKLGDPRLPQNQAGWAAMPPAVRQQVFVWLAKEWLILFFETVLPAHQDDHGRKDFWLLYCERITDFTVALSRRDELRVKTHLQKRPVYARLDHDTMSAFIMRFPGKNQDVVVVEFSEVGNAAYIHETPRFLQVVGNIYARSFRYKDQLKHWSKIDRILHNPPHGWQYKAMAQLAGYGIR